MTSKRGTPRQPGDKISKEGKHTGSGTPTVMPKGPVGPGPGGKAKATPPPPPPTSGG